MSELQLNQCPGCGGTNPSGSDRCRYCGSYFKVEVPVEVPGTWQFSGSYPEPSEALKDWAGDVHSLGKDIEIAALVIITGFGFMIGLLITAFGR